MTIKKPETSNRYSFVSLFPLRVYTTQWNCPTYNPVLNKNEVEVCHMYLSSPVNSTYESRI